MSYVSITWPRLASSLVLVVLALGVARRLKLDLGRDLAWGAVRAAAQLVAVGYLLVFLLAHDRPGLVLVVLAVMVSVASWTSARRVEHGPSGRVLLPWALLAIVTSGAIALVPVFLFVVPVRPLLTPRYLVPIAGMILANGMNVSSMVFERVFAAAAAQADEIEQLLALGATPVQALARPVRAAVRAALIPTVNGLTTAGLVALPGMMTGQIVAGTPPDEAVRYQIVILYQLVAVAAVAGLVSAMAARRLLFSDDQRLVLPTKRRASGG